VKDLLVESDAIYVCEGELDAVISSSVGLPTIGIPGASAFKPHYRLLLQDYERVVVLCDGDEAGRQFGKAIAKEIDTAVPISLPDGMDVNDLYLAGGREAILRMVEI
jgi:DNA primase